jgi:hypothetical protein
MIDLSTIPDDVMLARGQYSTVRAAHEDLKHKLSVKCGNLASLAAQILKRMQEDTEILPYDLLVNTDETVHDISKMIDEMLILAKQRKELKVKAWPK